MVKLVEAPELPVVVEFAYERQQRREEASMFCPGSREAILAEFREAMAEKRLAAYWSAAQDGSEAVQEYRKAERVETSGLEAWGPEKERLAGVLCWHVDEEKLRTDCALLMDSRCENYEEAAKALVREAQRGQREGMRYYFYFPGENERCGRFLENLRAHREENEYLLLLQREAWEKRGCSNCGEKETGKVSDTSEKDSGDVSGTRKKEGSGTSVSEKKPSAVEIRVLPGERYAEYIALHDSIFPDIYISGQDVIADVGKNHHVFVLLEEERIAAFSVLCTHGNRRATAELIGVKEDKRGQGYGRAVLSYLAFWAFGLMGMEALDLIVDSGNEKALRLYLDFGFQMECENRCYRL